MKRLLSFMKVLQLSYLGSSTNTDQCYVLEGGQWQVDMFLALDLSKANKSQKNLKSISHSLHENTNRNILKPTQK